MTIIQHLNTIIHYAFVKAGISPNCAVIIRPATKREFGDYQVNGVMAVAKKMQVSAINLANKVSKYIDKTEMIAKIEIAPPGFINIFIANNWLTKFLITNFKPPQWGVEKTSTPQIIVVDYSHPNIAKEMAVHHIRSTVIGDAIVRILSFLGHTIIRQNHIGDWGTQFGMLIALLAELKNNSHNNSLAILSDIAGFYLEAKKRFDQDEIFAKKSREYVVKLQSGNSECLAMWKKLVDVTMQQNYYLYERLNISLTAKDTMGESSYNDFLPNIIKDLKNKGLLYEDDGALLVATGENDKNGQPIKMIVQKSDGGYLYATTDLAALNYRVKNLHATRIIYCVDARQMQHLEQVFKISRKAGFVSNHVTLDHYAFGMMLGQDGKPFKTRTGEMIKLETLLNEAESKVINLLADKSSNLSEESKVEVIKALAIGSIKYADLSKNRTSNYVFDWEQMLSFEGNTAPYILYAYTRIKSIFRKARLNSANIVNEIVITNSAERILAIKLVQFPDIIENVAKDGFPHFLCTYLYELANCFMTFYEHCPVYKENVEKNCQNTRLNLCNYTANILKTGLGLLGINTVDKM